ncbi:MAG: hypoxanthine phosphoribosyltransferase [Candidatus Acidiferrum sp.]
MSGKNGATFSAVRIATRVAAMGREISRACGGRRLDVVVTMDRGFVFAADLIRHVEAPMVMHFVSEAVRDIEQSGHARREVFFMDRFAGATDQHLLSLEGRDILLVDAVIDSGITQEFLLRRLGERQPRSLRLAVLLDKPARRRVALEPDYIGFQTASNQLWVGYGLAAANGSGRNLRQLSSGAALTLPKRRSNGKMSGKRKTKGK